MKSIRLAHRNDAIFRRAKPLRAVINVFPSSNRIHRTGIFRSSLDRLFELTVGAQVRLRYALKPSRDAGNFPKIGIRRWTGGDVTMVGVLRAIRVAGSFRRHRRRQDVMAVVAFIGGHIWITKLC
jgi:hypothetical protein